MAAKKGNKYAIGNAGGRPTKYSPELLEKAKKYLKTCIDEEYERIKSDGEKSTTYELSTKVSLPTVAGLAVYLGVARDTIYEWKIESKEFSDTLESILAEQEKRLLNNGLSGIYNSNISKLLLVKHGYVERQEITGKDGTAFMPEPLLGGKSNGENK